MNILNLTLSGSVGGRREMVIGLATAMQRLRHWCIMAVLGDDPGPACEQVSAVRCIGRGSTFDWRAMRRLHALCRDERIDVIHTHDAASQLFAAMLRLRHPRSAPPALMTFHRSLDIESATWRDRLRNRLACALAGPVVAVSEERRRHYISRNRVRPQNVLCIPNGIDVERFRPDAAIRAAAREEIGATDGEIVLGAVGHFGDEKGLDIVLRTFRLMLDASPKRPLKLVILGTGTDDRRKVLEQLAVPCDARVSFLGYQQDTARWFQAFDILVHAPRQEAFGLVVVEAMAAGVPVVAARVGGIPEIIDDGQTGRLVEPNSAAAVCAAVLDLVASTELRDQLSRRAQEVVRQRFTVEIQAQRYLRLYEQLCSGAYRRAPDAADPNAAAWTAGSAELHTNPV